MREGSDQHGEQYPQRQTSELLPRNSVQVVGLNQNYTSRAGTGYHIQIEDRGPVFDDATEAWVRRVNTIAYANYGEPTARIIWGRDEDFPDLRTQEHNRFIEGKIQEAAVAARALLELREQRQTARIKSLLLHYHQSRGEEAKAEFEEANRLYPFVFARAWHELKDDGLLRRAAEAVATVEAGPPEPEIDETIYPLDPGQRELVLEIERVREELEKDLAELKRSGAGRRHPPRHVRQDSLPGPREPHPARGDGERLRGEAAGDDEEQPRHDLPAGSGPAHSPAGRAQSPGGSASVPLVGGHGEGVAEVVADLGRQLGDAHPVEAPDAARQGRVLQRVSRPLEVDLAVAALAVPAVATHADVFGHILKLAQKDVVLRDLEHLPEDHEADQSLPGLVEVGHAGPPPVEALQHGGTGAGKARSC